MQRLTPPNFTTAATNGATIYDQENMLTSNHEDTDVPQQRARARSLLVFYERIKEFTSWVQNDFPQDYKMKIIYFAQ